MAPLNGQREGFDYSQIFPQVDDKGGAGAAGIPDAPAAADVPGRACVPDERGGVVGVEGAFHAVPDLAVQQHGDACRAAFAFVGGDECHGGNVDNCLLH